MQAVLARPPALEEAGEPEAAAQGDDMAAAIAAALHPDKVARIVPGDDPERTPAAAAGPVLDRGRYDATAHEVVVRIPVLGAYSATWPMDCPKSDRIVRNLADLLAKRETPTWGAVLFLLSTGEERDLAVVRRWLKDCNGIGPYPWHKGMMGPGLCEYYLRTGDSRILPVIGKMADELRAMVYGGGWSGRGSAAFTYMAGGHLNAAGVHCLTFLLLARQCGVEVDEYTLQSALTQFYRFAGHGNLAYGDQWPEGGFRDNGKTAGLALAMAAAAELAPDGERSVYARARDNCAMKSFYATTWFMAGHTGGGIGELWHNVAMGLMCEKRPVQYRSFMDERRWVMELSRRFDGSIGISGGERYDASASESEMDWGTYFALAYTAPRKKLRLFGAPKNAWCKTCALPVRPWGTPADDAFCATEPVVSGPGQAPDLGREVVPTDASWPVGRRISDPQVSEETLLGYLRHPEFGLRDGAANAIVSLQRDALIVPMLKSQDPRIRHAGLVAITGPFKGRPLPAERLTPEMIELAGRMIDDPGESWWVAQEAMKVLARAAPEQIAPHVDRLVMFLANEDWWMQTTAMQALTPVAADKRFAPKVLPAVAAIVARGRAFQSTAPVAAIVRSLAAAAPEEQSAVLKLFVDAYAAIPDPIVAPGGQVTPGQTEVLRGRAFGFVKALPGSEGLLRRMPKLTSRWQSTRKDADKYIYDGTFTPNDSLVGTWQVIDRVATIDEFKMGRKRTPGGLPFARLEFRPGGATDQTNRVWTGHTLVDFDRGEALTVTLKQVEVPPGLDAMDLKLTADKADDVDLGFEEKGGKKAGRVARPFLFIEAGGFGGSNPQGWRTSYYVLKQAE